MDVSKSRVTTMAFTVTDKRFLLLSLSENISARCFLAENEVLMGYGQ